MANKVPPRHGDLGSDDSNALASHVYSLIFVNIINSTYEKRVVGRDFLL